MPRKPKAVLPLPPARVHVRWMIRRDVPDVLAIEAACRPCFAWSEADFMRCLRQRNCIGMVAEQYDRAIGFMAYDLHKTRLHVLNLAVTPRCQRNGVGHLMVEKLLAKLQSHRRTRITVAVRETNTAGQLFFRSHAFRATEVLPGYFADSGEDAYAMQYSLTGEDDWLCGGEPVNRLTAFDGGQ